MKSGYEQFFKTARKVANNSAPAEVKLRVDRRPKSLPLRSDHVKVELNKNKEMLKNEVERQLRQKVHFKVPKKSKSSWQRILLSTFGIAISILGYLNREKIENVIQNVEVSILGAAQAETGNVGAKAQEAKSSEAKPGDLNQGVKESKEADGSEGKLVGGGLHTEVSGDLSHLQKLVQRKKQLDDREAELARVEDEINKQKIEIEKRMKELEEMRARISSILEERVKIDEQKADSLMQMYSNMKPPQAAKVFETMDEELAVEILGRMKKKNAAEILNLLKPEKAQVISEKYAGYRRVPASSGGVKKD